MDHSRNVSVTAMRFRVRLTPKGGRDAIEGWWTGGTGEPALKARVAAPPEDGKANAALIGLLARALAVRKSDVRIASGAASRLKTIDVEGDEAVLAARLQRAAER
jgi:uncharacterized protein (TIGR00251 family)